MRILHILNHVQDIGNGIVNVCVDLACIQAKNGHDVSVVSGGGEFESLLSRYNVSHYTLDQSRTLSNMPRAFLKYVKILSVVKPDVVHAHMMTGVVLSKAINSLNGHQFRLVGTVHNEFQRSAIAMGLADRVIAVSEAVSRSMEKRGIPSRKLAVVLNGTIGTPRRHEMKNEICNDVYSPRLVTVAGMYERKGIQDLLESFDLLADEFPTLHLYLVGDGPDRARFEELALTLKRTQRIHFEGFKSNPSIYLEEANVFVLASHKEPCALVLIEAREAGIPIVATAVDGNPELLDRGNAGLLVPPSMPTIMAQAIRSILLDEEIRQNLLNGASNNLSHYTVERLYVETNSIYQEILS